MLRELGNLMGPGIPPEVVQQILAQARRNAWKERAGVVMVWVVALSISWLVVAAAAACVARVLGWGF